MPPKTKTPRSKAYLEFVRTEMKCVVVGCPNTNVEAAHVRFRNGGGMGLKPSDFRVVPLCFQCHRIQHQHGEVSFWDKESDKLKLGGAGDASDLAVITTLISYLSTKGKLKRVLEVLEGLAALEAIKED